MPRARLARLFVHLAGAAVTLTCIGFFARALVGILPGLDRVPETAFIAAAALCPCYFLMLFLLAQGWKLLLRAAQPQHAPDVPLIATYALTQFAKYLPGNIFHLAGRHAILTRRHFSQRALLASTFQENLLLVVSACLVGTAMIVLFPGHEAEHWLRSAGIADWLLGPRSRSATALFFVVFAAGAIGPLLSRLTRTSVARTLSLDCLFFVLQGACFTLLVYAVSGKVHPEAMAVVAFGWIAGFLAPAAPGGAGVREVVMLFLLSGSIARGDVVLSAALYRVVTFAGDLLFFAFGLVLTKLHAPGLIGQGSPASTSSSLRSSHKVGDMRSRRHARG